MALRAHGVVQLGKNNGISAFRVFASSNCILIWVRAHQVMFHEITCQPTKLHTLATRRLHMKRKLIFVISLGIWVPQLGNWSLRSNAGAGKGREKTLDPKWLSGF